MITNECNIVMHYFIFVCEKHALIFTKDQIIKKIWLYEKGFPRVMANCLILFFFTSYQCRQMYICFLNLC